MARPIPSAIINIAILTNNIRMPTLAGRVALITGGARGIGKGIAQSMLEAGAKVMIADLGKQTGQWSYPLADDDELQKTVKALSVYGEIQATSVDVTDSHSCHQAVATTLKVFGQLDILANNAGVIDSGSIADFSESAWEQIFAVNVKGVFLMTKAALGALRQSKNASILNTASIAGKKGHPNLAAYCGSKFAVIGITQSFALELGAENIRVNALCPGMVGTAMWDHLMPSNATDGAQRAEELEAALSEQMPLGRSQTTTDMGEAAVYLVSAPNVTGISLVVAGGFEMH